VLVIRLKNGHHFAHVPGHTSAIQDCLSLCLMQRSSSVGIVSLLQDIWTTYRSCASGLASTVMLIFNSVIGTGFVVTTCHS
jgi:hypothetical protein